MPYGIKIQFEKTDSMDKWIEEKKLPLMGCNRTRATVKLEIPEDNYQVIQDLIDPAYQKKWNILGWEAWKIKQKEE